MRNHGISYNGIIIIDGQCLTDSVSQESAELLCIGIGGKKRSQIFRDAGFPNGCPASGQNIQRPKSIEVFLVR